MNIRPIITGAVLAASSLVHAQPITDSFTYQGTLQDNGAPANGFYDMTFFVYDSEVGGTLVPGGIEFAFNIEVFDGVFEWFVEFATAGSVFDSDQTRWLQVSVKEVGGAGFTPLTPRQRITPAPLANYALRSGFALQSGSSLQDAYDNGSTIFRGAGDPVEIRSSGAGAARLDLGSNIGNEQEGELYMYGPTGSNMFRVVEDVSAGGGGFLSFARNNLGNSGFVIDGNVGSTESTQVSIFGVSSSIILSTGLTDDLSVQLPNNAINSTEILNEVGVTDTSNSASVLLTNDPATIDVVASVTIDCPTDGFVFVIASCELSINHDLGIVSDVNLGVSDTVGSFPSNGDLKTRIFNDIPSGFYSSAVTVHSVFPATAGSNSFYFLGDKNHVGFFVNVIDTQLSAIFIPTEYGSGVLRQSGPNLPDEFAPVTGPMTNYDIVMEQNASLRANAERQQREIDEMRAQVREILEQSHKDYGQQSQD